MSSIREKLGINNNEDNNQTSSIREKLGITKKSLEDEKNDIELQQRIKAENSKTQVTRKTTGLKWIDANLNNIDDRTYQNALELSDYQNDIPAIKLGSTAGDLVVNAGKGLMGTAENLVDLGRYGVAGVADLIGAKDYANDVRERAKQDTTSMILSPVEDFFNKNSLLKENGIIENVAQGVGQIGGIIGSGGLLPKAVSTVNVGKFAMPTTSILSGAGRGMTEAYNNGATNGQALAAGIGGGLVEGFSESLFGGLGSTFSKKFGGGALDDVIVKRLTDKISNKTLQTLAQSGLKATGEGFEEVISGLGNAFTKKLTYMNKEDIGKLINDEDLLNSFVVGTLTSAVAQTPSTIKSIKTGNSYINLDNDNQVNQNTLQNITNNTPDSSENIQSNINISTNQNNAENGTQNSLNELTTNNNIQKYRYLPTNNEKSNNLKQSASKYFNNSQDTINLLNTIDKVVQDKGYNILFDNTIVNPNGQSVNAQIKTLSNGELEIRINPNSNRAGEFLIMHEVTHAIENDSMKKLIIDYASKNSEFSQALESLKQTYGTNDVSSEVVADISGQLFGNQEFINNLSTKQPNIFKRIYNKIIELANKITGNSKESLFIKDLKNKWETAYRNTTTEQAVNSLGTDIRNSKNLGGYLPDINVSTNEIGKFNITDYNNLKEVKQKIYDYYKDNYISNEQISKPITNIDTGLKVEIWKSGINETFGNANYYKNLSETDKKIKLATMDSLAKMIKYGEIRANSATNYHNSNSTAEYYYLEHPITIDGTQYIVNMDIRKVPNTNGRFYIHSINTKKIGTPGNSKSRPLTVPISNNTIPQSNNNVKSEVSTKYSMQNNQNNTQELDNSSFSFKQKQLEIIQNNNPVQDDYHTWIRNIDDIKTLEETINDSDWIDYDEFNPDLTRQNIQDAINSGKITVYSSYPIEQGIFVSPSKMEAESYSSDGKVYSKEVNVDDIAWIDPTQGQYAKVQTSDADIRYSQENDKWQEYLENNYKATGTRTDMKSLKLPTANKETITNNKTLKGDVLPKYNDGMKVENTNKILNPNEISKLTKIDANTTPKLPTVNRNKVNDGNSKFWDNINDKTNMLDEKQKQLLLTDEEVKYYDTITNKQSLETAFKRLESNGTHETENWFSKKSENATAIDVAEGWILLKQYSDSGDTDGMVAVAKKMRDMGTKAGQTVQAFNIMERMTPEGMVKYAQTELSEAYDKMVKNKSKDWINKYRSDFDLTPNEVQFIMDNMKAISKMEDGYDKRVKLAEIQKVLTDKLPPERGAGTKAWMRISMLFNPKTQVRNVMGNAIITPVNYFSDLFASGVDKIISKKTGVRTTGVTNVKNYAKGFKQGLYESYNDFKKGINTRNLEGNRFEVTEGKSFNNKTFIGKNLNRVDNLLGFMLDAGDRGFYEATFTNSINNQKVLNNTDNVTQEMIDIATKEALSRTWQDNNGYTNFVLNIRKGLNKINVKGYGLGDVLIPFAKTPANLTKAIVDYSPAGLVNTLITGKNLLRSFGNGQYNSNLQYDFVQNLGKATAGSMLYVLGYALAKAGIISGDSDDDKDVSNFMKNTLGISSYSIKIGGKNFTYDWAQPIAAPLSIMANYVQKQKDNPNANTLENIISSLDVAGNILLEQSFMDSINTVLNNNDGFVSGLQESIMELPSRAIPTLMKQIVDLTDSTQRQTYTYDKPLETMKNKVIAKIPGLSKSLAPSVDTLGREIQRYGGKNNIFNVFFNPANVNTENISESAKEIYKIYKSTGDSAVMPKQVAYYINQDGEKIVLTNEQRAEYQKISGELIEKSVSKTMKQSSYQNMDDELKADTLSNIVNYSYEIAKSKVLNQEVGNTYKTAYEYSKIGDVGDYYSFKESIDDTDKDTKRKSITNFLINSSLNDEQLAFLYGNYYSSEDTLDLISNFEIPMKEFIKYNSQGFENEYNADGTISNSKKNQILNYINSLNLNVAQKAILYKMKYSSYSKYDNAILTYINKLDLSKFEKSSLAKQLGFSNYDDYLISYIKTLNISEDDKIKQLKSLGFTVYTSNGKTYVKKG